MSFSLHRRLNFAMIFALVLSFAACTKENPEALKEKTAEATANLKQNAKAMAEGVREGWNRNKPLNLNRATREELSSLPGISDAQADRIIANRPYKDPSELLTRKIVPQAEYNRISDRIKV